MKKSLIVFGLILLLSGCASMYQKESFVEDRDKDYLNAQNTQPLVMPEGVSGVQLGNDFTIPSYNYMVPTKPVSLVPPGSAAAR